LFVPAILVAATLGGLGPGIFATLLSFASSLLLLRQHGAATPPDLIAHGIFLLVGGGIAWSGERLRLSHAAEAQQTDDLRAREAHLQSILATVPDALIVIDERGLVTSFSAPAERLF